MKDKREWKGSATELLGELEEKEIAPTVITKILNEYHYTKLKENKITYAIVRNRNSRQIILKKDDNSDKCDNELKVFNNNNNDNDNEEILKNQWMWQLCFWSTFFNTPNIWLNIFEGWKGDGKFIGHISNIKIKRKKIWYNLSLFPIKKYLEDFDRKLYKTEFIKEFEELDTLEFIDKKENIILIGTPGAGKTHYAIGLEIKACMEGKNVLFISVSNLIIELKEAMSKSQLTAYKRNVRCKSLEYKKV